MWIILKLWKQIWHQWVENSTPLVEFEPTMSQLPTEFHWWSSCIRSSKQCISNMFLYKSGATNQEIVYENDKKNMDWRCPMTAIWILRFREKRRHLQLGMWQKLFQHKNSYKNDKWSTVSQKMHTGFYRGLYSNFLSWLNIWLVMHRIFIATDGNWCLSVTCNCHAYIAWIDR